MKNEELSKRISDLKCEIENIKRIVEAEGSLAKHEPSIFERFPGGSHICGLEIISCVEGDSKPFQIKLPNENAWIKDTWIEKEIIETLADCHDWIEKYHPFLEEYRKEWEYMEGYPVLRHTIASEKVGLWASKTPVKKPWEDA